MSLENGAVCETECFEDIDESEINILKKCDSEWDLVLATWRKTHSFRQHELKHGNMEASEYIEKYQVILHEKSYELVSINWSKL